MDGIIEVKVGGNYIQKDNKNAGVRGEANVTMLRITFDESWSKYTKKITFWDARGLNPRYVYLDGKYLKGDNVYLVPIPAEPLALAGEMTFTIDGFVDEQRKRSVEGKLEVKDSPIADDATEPVPPTQSEVEQMQRHLEEIKEDIADAVEAKVSAEAAKETAEEKALQATESANNAELYASKAEASVGRTSYIGVDGYWYAWDSEKGVFYNTGVKAQAGSTVYYGDNPPSEADVWIEPDGDGHKCLTEADVVDVIRDTALQNLNNMNGADMSLPPSMQVMLDYTSNYCSVYGDDIQGLRQEMYDGYVSNESAVDVIKSNAIDSFHGDVALPPTAYFMFHFVDGYMYEYYKKAEIDEKTEILRADVEGLQQQINEEAHFRGYLSTNAKIQALNATPNDFAYSSESGTKWVYDAENGWIDTGSKVPDQLTPASMATPLMDGVPTAGESEEYARGDHRHPTDTTRVSVSEFNTFKGDLETALDNIITIQNSLIGGGSV